MRYNTFNQNIFETRMHENSQVGHLTVKCKDIDDRVNRINLLSKDPSFVFEGISFIDGCHYFHYSRNKNNIVIDGKG